MSRPNVIVLTVDMVRSDMLGKFETFRKLKKKGVLFSEMITYAPYTIASLHSIFTSLYGKDTNVDGYFKPVKFDKENCITLPQYFQKSGYYTEGDLMAELTLPHQGFDKVTVHDEHKDNLLERHREIIERVAKMGKSYFLYLHYSNIHTEVVKNVIRKYKDFDEEYFGKREENRQRYESYVRKACDYLEGILDTVEKNGLWDNTLFVILSDHGCGIGEKPGEKAYGVYTYDYSIKVFCFFILKEALPQDRQITAQVRSVDIMPTILDIAGLKPDERYKKITGQSLMDMIKGKETADRLAFCETGGLEGPNPSPYGPNVQCIRSRKWKLIYNSSNKEKELYDLENDPEERNNCVDEHPDIALKMWDKLVENTRRA